ncbi:MAG: hypothetical protein JO013_04375 [Alphaproteobacteria bacterium]|nr:hypothetical protein [Alphaproteobacteria bacterium]
MATKQQDDEFTLGDLVTLYLHQNGAVNQLWAIYAGATFTAGLFALNEGANSTGFLVAGGLGFAAFTVGHAIMVWSTLNRMKIVVSDIAEISGKKASPEHPRIIHQLARTDVGIRYAILSHLLIDVCVCGAFVTKLWLLWHPLKGCH